MSGPKHWTDDGAPAEFAQLLHAVRNEQPSPASLQRALIAAGIVGASAITATSLSAAGTATVTANKLGLASMLWKLVLVSSVGAGAVSITVGVIAERRAAAERATLVDAQKTAARKAIGPARKSTNGVGLESSHPTTDPAVVPALEVTSRSQPDLPRETDAPRAQHGASVNRNPNSAAPSNASSGTLFEEMALIEAARTNFGTNNLRAALESSMLYNRKFAAGQFAPEALFLQMQASRQLGQSQLAIDSARQLIKRFPKAPNIARAHELLQSQGVNEFP